MSSRFNNIKNGPRVEIGRSRSIQVVISIFERLIQRGSAAMMSFLVAIMAGPSELGIYASGLLIFTIYQAILETTFRQTGVTAWNLKFAGRFINNMSVLLAIAGVTVMVTGLAILARYTDDNFLILQMTPIVLCPVFSALYLKTLTAAQRSGHSGWLEIGKKQLYSCAISLLIALPVVLHFPVLGASIQLLLAEAIFALLLRYPQRIFSDGDIYDRSFYARYVIPTSLSNLFGWSQSQLERLIMLILSGPVVMGVYTFSIAIARTVSDSVSTGSVNAVRSQISTEERWLEKDKIYRSGAFRAQAIALGCQSIVSAFGVFVLPSFMGAEWDESFGLIPLLGISCVPAALAWLTSAYAIEAGRAKALLPVQIVGIFLAIAVGFTLANSLILGAMASVMRDLFAVSVRLQIMRSCMTKAFILRALIMNLLSIGIGLGLYFLGGTTL